MSTPLYTNLLPLRDYTEHSVLPYYSQDGTGMGGLFVTLLTGNQDPLLSAGRYAGSVGATFAGTFNGRYENPRKFTVSASGENKAQVLGLSLYGTVETDANGQRLILNPGLAEQYGCVISGQSSPVATAGSFRLKSNAYVGTPIPGYVGVIAGAGKVYFKAADSTDFTSGLAVCKVISSSGAGLGGYADIVLTLN